MTQLPLQFHHRVPRTRVENLKFRRFVLAKCRTDLAMRRDVLSACSQDFLFWVNTFVWQFNPNSTGPHSVRVGPFVTWGSQEAASEKIIAAIEGRSDLVIEKSREEGGSVLVLLVPVWMFLFREMQKFLVISRNEDMVDKPGDSDCLFWKIDFFLKHLPEWMATTDRADGVGKKKVVHRGTISRKAMGFENRENGSMITGQATTEKMGVGGRADAMILDEFSRVPNAWTVYNSTSNTTNCRVFNGTHFGTGTCFDYLTKKAGTVPNLDKAVLHWSMHADKKRGLYRWDRDTQRVEYLDPEYVYPPDFKPVTDGTPAGGPFPGLRSPWYDDACLRKSNARAVAADLDINPTGSVEQLFDPVVVNDLITLYTKDPLHACDLEWHRDSAEPVRLHDHAGGLLKLWQRLPPDGKPLPGRFVFCADTAQGNGKATASCLSGVNMETGEKVFEYANPSIEPRDFAYLAVAVCRLFSYRDDGGTYRPARLGWETGGPGSTFGKHVVLLGHTDVYRRTADHLMKKTVSDEPGWVNTRQTLQNLMVDYRDALRGRRFMNPSKDALLECLNFVFDTDGFVSHTGAKHAESNSEAKQNHGDMTIADALCWKLVSEGRRLIGVPPRDGGVATVATGKRPGTLAWRRGLSTMGANRGWGN